MLVRPTVIAGVAALACFLGLAAAPSAGDARPAADPAVVTVHPSPKPRGVLVTSGGWAYCLQVQALARRFRLTLLCGRYHRDRYTGFGLRSRRLLDWGDPAYLRSLAARAAALHERVGGTLVLLGVSYSGFGVATLASHHPELRPDRLIVIDSFLDLAARRAVAGSDRTGAEIDTATGGTPAAIATRDVSVRGLARLVRGGTRLTVIWSVSEDERREFRGATCNRDASAGALARLASALGRPVRAWVTRSKHGHDLWDSGRRIMKGRPPGRTVVFRPGANIPAFAICG